MTRGQWIAAVRINFPGVGVKYIKGIIRNERTDASKLPLYHPGMGTGWHVPSVIAEYHIQQYHKWWYVMKEDKSNSVFHAVIKYCRKFRIHYPSFISWNDSCEKRSLLDPAWSPTRHDNILLELDLMDVNHHEEARLFIAATGGKK